MIYTDDKPIEIKAFKVLWEGTQCMCGTADYLQIAYRYFGNVTTSCIVASV